MKSIVEYEPAILFAIFLGLATALPNTAGFMKDEEQAMLALLALSLVATVLLLAAACVAHGRHS